MIQAKSIKIIEQLLRKEELKFEDEIEKELIFASEFEYDEATFMELADKWLQMKRPRIELNTYEGYKRIIDNRLNKEFGKYKIKNLTPPMIEMFYSRLATRQSRQDGQKGSISTNTIRRHHAVLKAIFNDSKRLRLISNNIMETVLPPKELKHYANYYTQEDIEKMMPCLLQENNQFICIILLIALTGARRGEIAAITWKDIDWDKKTLLINKVISITSNDTIVKKPKTESRLIQLPEMLVPFLKKLYLSELEKKATLEEKKLYIRK